MRPCLKEKKGVVVWGKGLMRASLPKIPIPTFNLSWHFSIYVILIYTPTQTHVQAHTCTHTVLQSEVTSPFISAHYHVII